MAAIDPGLRLASVRLAVSDLPRSVEFYERVLGLPLVALDADGARLGPDPERPALLLEGIEHPTPLSPASTGLFHVAWLHPSRAALAVSVRRVVGQRWPFDGASDHGVSEALYLTDPDGLGIELYADRPRAEWLRPPGGHGVRMVTLPLDLDDLLTQDPGGAVASIDPGTTVGHVHMKVSDVPRATNFYRDALGFEEQATMPSAAFLSAGGYHHHVGLNSWQSAGAAPAPDSAPALREVQVELGNGGAVEELERRLRETAGAEAIEEGPNGGLSVRDPDGQLLTFGSQ
ncbi:MAG: Glyoxalase/bleomycin resistance protein/dioxygenase [Solirubrobacterales bacterium]|nr:Glyoxalase/bleomycin resistance protein/dioxygenase [Solirubrobacterales bacterium]